MAKANKPKPQAAASPAPMVHPPAAPAAPVDLAGDKPVCPYCKLGCVAGHSSNAITYYYCPNRPTCRFAAKRLRRDFQQKMARDRAAGRPKGQPEDAPRS